MYLDHSPAADLAEVGQKPGQPFLRRALLLSVALCACVPLRDLDKAGAGSGVGGRGGTPSGGAASSLGGNIGNSDKGDAGGTTSSTSPSSVGGDTGTGGSNQSGDTSSPTGGSSWAASTTPSSSGGADTTSIAALGGAGGVHATTSWRTTKIASAGTGESGVGGAGAGGTTETTQFGGSAGLSVTGSRQLGGAAGGPKSSVLGGSTSTGGKTARAGGGGTTQDIAPDLPNISSFPITGQIQIEPGTWIIKNEEAPTYEIQTPVARYRLLTEVAAIISINDSAQRQWIDYSDFSSTRGLPALKWCCETGLTGADGSPQVTTVVDDASRTTTHLRLTSKSSDGSIYLVWDFYLTHVTITINRLEVPYGFTFRGVPGGYLDVPDVVRLSTGESKSAVNAFDTELPGPEEWMYFADPDEGQSLFMIRHGDDDKTDSYIIVGPEGGHSAQFTFSGGQDTLLPQRFSVGLIDSVDHAKVSERVNFVINAIQ
jgi:hypothetical protein